MNAPKIGDGGTDSVLVVLVVPDHWKRLPEEKIEELLRHPANVGIFSMMAKEIKRWAGVPAANLTELQNFIDARTKP